jgi:hypothetical protein
MTPEGPRNAPGQDPAGEGVGVALALVPARDEAGRVGATVRALRGLPGVAEVLVVSDGSTDATAARALEAGAHCLDLPRNVGKGGALNAGLAALMGRVAERLSPEPAVLLLADADLADSAGRLDRLLAPVLAGEADLAIADLPAQEGAGGFGVAMGLARRGMARVTGRRMAEPLSGQRAVRWEALPALLPFAPGFGVEVAMTMDALRAGLRVVEVEVDLRHKATGKDLAGLLHRARQARAVARELTRRKAWRPTPDSAMGPVEAGDEKAGDEKAGDEKAGDEKAGDEKAGDEEAPGAQGPGRRAPGREGSRGGREGGGGFPQPPEPQPPEPQPPEPQPPEPQPPGRRPSEGGG